MVSLNLSLIKILKNEITTKKLVIILVCSAIVSILTSLYISRQVAGHIAKELRHREVELLFGAIESGPLAFARLHSSAIAQELLERLVSNKSLEGRAVLSVEVRGGANQDYLYALWSSNLEFNQNCVYRLERVFQFADAIHPYKITLAYNKCKLLPEERAIYISIFIAIILIILIVVFALSWVAWPVIHSIQKAELLIFNNAEKASPLLLESIPFLPVRYLAQRALKSVQLQKEASLAKLAQQVAHDIRSPLAALNAVEKDIAVLPEDTRILLRSAIGRIKDIANNLMERSRADTQKLEAQLIIDLLSSITTEKRIQFRNRSGLKIEFHFDAQTYGSFSLVEAVEFKRVISNLINNAAEAIADKGQITLRLENLRNCLRIFIIDNGKGIPEYVLPKLTKRGETFGKAGGTGLGLFHARTTIESWSGQLTIQSQIGKGTTVEIKLPIAKSPDWFLDSLVLSKEAIIVILDDDQSIHQIWKSRFDSILFYETDIKLLHFFAPSELKHWHELRNNQINYASELPTSIFYLIDYELLGFSESGLDLIEELNIANHSVLVTSRYEEAGIKSRCIKLNTKVLPKAMAGSVPIIFK